MKINRRKFVTESSFSAAAIMLGGNLAGCTSERNTGKNSEKKDEISSYDIMKDVMKYRKIDSHMHLRNDAEQQLAIMDALGIERATIVNAPSSRPPDEVRASNDAVIKTVKQYPDRFIGFFTVNPRYTTKALEEIKRCADLGMAGHKGYTEAKINDPLYFPIIEKLIDLNMIIHMHSFCQLGMAGYRMKYDIGRAPNTTRPEDMADAAKRYPEAMFQFAHIAGGGDWEYECKILKDYPNIYVDVGGSNNEENVIDFAIRYLGEDRIFFGTDNCYHHGVGKILASNATEDQKKKIFFENFNNILRKGGHHVD
jgi:predicted TIM-barrel fold metal-dependent hydrolase